MPTTPPGESSPIHHSFSYHNDPLSDDEEEDPPIVQIGREALLPGDSSYDNRTNTTTPLNVTDPDELSPRDKAIITAIGLIFAAILAATIVTVLDKSPPEPEFKGDFHM